MKVMFVGAGEVGYHVIDALYREGVDITALDNDAVVLEHLREDYNISTILGNAIDPALMQKLDMSEVDLFLAVTNSDETNIIACLMADGAGVKTKIARVKTIEFGRGESVSDRRFLGIDLIINPYEVAAEHLASLVRYPHALDVHHFLDDRLLLLRVRIDEDSPLANQTVKSIGQQAHLPNTLIALVVRQNSYTIPHGDDTVLPGDHLYLFAELNQVRKLFQFLELSIQPARRVFINGGGHIGFALANRLEERNVDVRILEINEPRCHELSQKLDRSLILHADGTDAAALKVEGIEGADFFISVTDADEVNVVSCLMAKELGARTTVALVKQPEFISMLLDNPGIDISFSPRLLTARKILRFVRGKEVSTFFSFPNSDIELLELQLQPGMRCEQGPIMSLGLPAGMLVGAVKRGEHIFVPGGNDTLRQGDTLLLIQQRRNRNFANAFFLEHPDRSAAAPAEPPAGPPGPAPQPPAPPDK